MASAFGMGAGTEQGTLEACDGIRARLACLLTAVRESLRSAKTGFRTCAYWAQGEAAFDELTQRVQIPHC